MGLGHLRKHLMRMGVFNGNPVYRSCGQCEDTADYLIFDCDELREVRASILGFMARGGYLFLRSSSVGRCKFIRLKNLEES